MNSIEEIMTMEDKVREIMDRLGRSEEEVIYALSETDDDPTRAGKYLDYENREIYSFQGKFSATKTGNYGFFVFLFDKQEHSIIRKELICIQNYDIYASFDVKKSYEALSNDMDNVSASSAASGVECLFGEESLVRTIDSAFEEEISKGISEVDMVVLSDSLSKGIGRSIGDGGVIVDIFSHRLSSDEVKKVMLEDAKEYCSGILVNALDNRGVGEDANAANDTRGQKINIAASAPVEENIVLKTKFVVSPVEGRRVIELLKGDRIFVEVVGDEQRNGLRVSTRGVSTRGASTRGTRISAVVENVQLAEDGGYNVVSVAGNGILCVSHGQGDLKVKVEDESSPAETVRGGGDSQKWNMVIYIVGAILIAAIIIIVSRIGR